MFSVILAAALLMSLTAPLNVAAAVKMNRTKVTLAVKQKTSLTVEGTSKKPSWTSSNSAVASVSGGVVTARKEGSAVITAKIGSKKYTSKITVTGNYKKLYKKFLETTPDAKWYYVLDINKNGLPDLITCTGEFFDQYKVYTVYKGKVVYTGYYGIRGGAAHTLHYVSGSKGLLSENWTNGVGGIHDNLYTLSGTKFANTKYAYKDMYGYQTGTDSAHTKKVSKSTYESYIKKYFKITNTYKMLSNTSANRKKSFG